MSDCNAYVSTTSQPNFHWQNQLQWGTRKNFLSYSNFFYLLVVRVDGCCCSWSHSMTQAHIRRDSSGRWIGPSQRPLPDNAQHSKETESMFPAGFEPAIPAREWPLGSALVPILPRNLRRCSMKLATGSYSIPAYSTLHFYYLFLCFILRMLYNNTYPKLSLLLLLSGLLHR